MLVLASDVKGCLAATILSIDVSATVQQQPDNLKIVVAASDVVERPLERRPHPHRGAAQPDARHRHLPRDKPRHSQPHNPPHAAWRQRARPPSPKAPRHSSFEPADVVVVCQLSPADLQAHRPNIHLGQRILQQCLESGQSPALGTHLHRHFLFALCCRDLHCSAPWVCLVKGGRFRGTRGSWEPTRLRKQATTCESGQERNTCLCVRATA